MKTIIMILIFCFVEISVSAQAVDNYQQSNFSIGVKVSPAYIINYGYSVKNIGSLLVAYKFVSKYKLEYEFAFNYRDLGTNNNYSKASGFYNGLNIYKINEIDKLIVNYGFKLGYSYEKYTKALADENETEYNLIAGPILDLEYLLTNSLSISGILNLQYRYQHYQYSEPIVANITNSLKTDTGIILRFYF